MWRDSSLHRNTAAWAWSSADSGPPPDTGMRTFTMSSVSGSEAARLAIGVRVSAGRIALKRMPSAPYWHAPLTVSALIPPLAADYANVLNAPATGLVAATDEM